MVAIRQVSVAKKLSQDCIITLQNLYVTARKEYKITAALRSGNAAQGKAASQHRSEDKDSFRPSDLPAPAGLPWTQFLKPQTTQ